jgi:hypothetical protein
MQCAEVISEPDEEEDFVEPMVPSSARRFLNLRLRFLVGNYVAAMSAMLNCRIGKQIRSSSLFAVRIGPNRCIFDPFVILDFATYFANLKRQSGTDPHRYSGKDEDS